MPQIETRPRLFSRALRRREHAGDIPARHRLNLAAVVKSSSEWHLLT
jgi:hypothetical protein